MTLSMMGAADLTTPASSFTAISIRRGCKCIVKCLETEKSWAVLQLVLKELPNILQNKALIQGNDVDLLARTLYNLYNAKGMTDNFAPKPSQSDFQNIVLPVIASLPTYHQVLEPSTQTKIVDALRKGLRTKICVQALTILILEMPDTLVRELPEVLLQMSKLSDTVNTAVAVLEFLSSEYFFGWLDLYSEKDKFFSLAFSALSRLPNQRFANFIQVHFMYVFAISLPYTNPYRYDHYTVSLAHHVVAGWFLKCRLHIRRSVVKYIIVVSGLGRLQVV
jgi:tuberous sclerosis 2